MFNGLKRKDATFTEERGDVAYALSDLIVYVPERYMKAGFCDIDLVVTILGIFIVQYSDKHYTLINMPVRIKLYPSRFEVETINGTPYVKFYIPKGKQFSDLVIVQSSDTIKPLFAEFIVKGNIPVFIQYEDLRETFEVMSELTGFNIADDKVAISQLIALVARCEEDTTRIWKSRLPKDKLKWVGLANVGESRLDSYSRIIGAYLTEALTKSLLEDNAPENPIEKLLK